MQARKYGTGESATWGEGDWNGDGVFDNLDVLAALQTGNYLQGTYAAKDLPSGDISSLLSDMDVRSSDDDTESFTAPIQDPRLVD